MPYAKPSFSRTAIDKAGERLLVAKTDDVDVNEARDVLANWRSAHAFPLNSIATGLKQKVRRIDQGGIVVQRLKRARSIVSKLSDKPSMRLTQMQDIGGCRAIVGSVSDVYALRDLFAKSRSQNELVSQDDYMANPKESGYRSLHLIFRYKSRAHPEYNKLLIEIQLRTQTQHAWATAVETVGAVIGQALKSSEGESSWLRYFQCAAVALEYSEHPAFGTMPMTSKGEIARTLADLDQKLQVHTKLSAYGDALKATEDLRSSAAGYFLLVLLPGEPGVREPELRVQAFAKHQVDLAYAEYERIERSLPLRGGGPQLSLFPELNESSGAQAVLVGAESFRSIRDSFPNYYLDTKIFLRKVDDFVRRYRRSK